MNVDIAELLAEQLKEEQRLHRRGDFEKAEVFQDLEKSLKNMHLYLSGEMPSYTDEKIRMFGSNGDKELWIEQHDVKKRVKSVKRLLGAFSKDEHNASS